jgi:hypothetical protein
MGAGFQTYTPFVCSEQSHRATTAAESLPRPPVMAGTSLASASPESASAQLKNERDCLAGSALQYGTCGHGTCRGHGNVH